MYIIGNELLYKKKCVRVLHLEEDIEFEPFGQWQGIGLTGADGRRAAGLAYRQATGVLQRWRIGGRVD